MWRCCHLAPDFSYASSPSPTCPVPCAAWLLLPACPAVPTLLRLTGGGDVAPARLSLPGGPAVVPLAAAALVGVGAVGRLPVPAGQPAVGSKPPAGGVGFLGTRCLCSGLVGPAPLRASPC